MTLVADKLIIGCGYLGERVAHRWLAQGARVAALTRSPERAKAFRRASIEPVIGDVLEPALLEALPDAETVLYAVGYDRRSGRSQREVYVAGLENALARIARRTRRLIYISSVSVYGQSDGETVDERSPCTPNRENGQACLDAEAVVWKHFAPGSAEESGACVLRLTGIYGPHRLLQRVDALRAGEPIAGDPDGWLNLIHVGDAVNAVLACEERGRAGETYLVCDDEPVRRRDYYARLASVIGAPVPQFEGSGGRTSGLNKRCSNRKLREELGVELAFPTYREGLLDSLRT